ncbi:IclR family transcriptional regulator C-terminal domain-containing protein [Halomonas sp. hl-4]|uniref:IclR family transcriptional regulator C-terminal domain-containing protein n=1 Tax=Halomonas sp. hl-4 TaxID=1761789 RepID=UPI001E39119F|nr:IclR family transcriptional regulator C-terminal domain-containing protein [Halomonas sp. hl-4]
MFVESSPCFVALDEATCEQYLAQLTLEPVTHRTCTTIDALRKEFTVTRELGYAIDDEENELGIICFGQAGRGAGGRVEGAISVSVPCYRLPDNGQQRIFGVHPFIMSQCRFGVSV